MIPAMSVRYLEVTYRNGRPLAAYLAMPRLPGERAAGTRPLEHGLVADFASDGRLIGIEITDPATATLPVLNAALAALGQPPLGPADAARLAAA